MGENNSSKRKIYWWKAILNGLLAWLIGLAVFMIPGMVVGFKMGYELSTQLKDPAAINAEISRTISTMYRENVYLHIFYLILMVLLIIWRSQKVVRLPQSHALVNGAIVGAVPLLAALLLFQQDLDLFALIEIVLFLAAGMAPALWKK